MGGYAQLREDCGELRGRIIEHNLFERAVAFGQILDVVGARCEEKHLAASDFVAHVARVDELPTAEDHTDCVSREVVRLDTVSVGLHVLCDYGLLHGRGIVVEHRLKNFTDEKTCVSHS